MSDTPRTLRLGTEALIIGYAMSRLDLEYFRYRNAHSSREVYEEAAQALAVRRHKYQKLNATNSIPFITTADADGTSDQFTPAARGCWKI